MRTSLRYLAAILVAALGVLFSACAGARPASASGTVASPAQQTVNPDAAALADFTERVKSYAALRNKVDNFTPKLKQTTNPAEIMAAQKALADAIRAARTDAKPGAIFTPEIRQRFLRLLRPELKGKDGAETKATIQADNPGELPLQVNASYPEKAPLSTVPPNVLLALPPLPDELEYRFVGKHMILRDTRANLIVDFILNAISVP